MDIREIGWEVVEWIHLAQAKDQWQGLVNTVINVLVPLLKAGNFVTGFSG
jgi:hypothetical protein